LQGKKGLGQTVKDTFKQRAKEANIAKSQVVFFSFSFAVDVLLCAISVLSTFA